MFFRIEFSFLILEEKTSFEVVLKININKYVYIAERCVSHFRDYETELLRGSLSVHALKGFQYDLSVQFISRTSSKIVNVKD